ncbi:hypothetical protein Tco_0745330 [Tanacetum coccineum]
MGYPSEDPYEEAVRQLWSRHQFSRRELRFPEVIRTSEGLHFTTPRPSREVGESSAAAAARQPGPTMAHGVDCSFVDTMETKFGVLYPIRMPEGLCAVRAKIKVLRRERLASTQGEYGRPMIFGSSEYHAYPAGRLGSSVDTLGGHWVAVPRLGYGL